jgi:Tfp pilus assembly protein PilF
MMEEIHMNKRRILTFVLLSFLLLAAACGDPAAKKQKYFSRGQELFTQGDYVNAALELKNAIQVERNSPPPTPCWVSVN